MIDPYPLLFDPILVEKPWGGERLASLLGKPTNAPIGELWSLSSHPDKPSIISNGILCGSKLSDVTDCLLSWGVPTPFPLLLKLLDAVRPLSLQVHPSDSVAELIGPKEKGKTEAWLVLEAVEDAEVVLGLNEDISFDKLAENIGTSLDIMSLLRKIKVHVGDVVPVPAGTVHTTLGSMFFAEVQQVSDSTYRIYDWQDSGRELHLEKAKKAAVSNLRPNVPTHRVQFCSSNFLREQLWACDYFVMEKITLKKEWSPPGDNAVDAVMSLDFPVILEHGSVSYVINPGMAVLIPPKIECKFIGQGASMLRVVQPKSKYPNLWEEK